MCVIVYKPKNIPLPSEDTLFSCYLYNNDGVGYTFTDEHKNVIVKKGYSNFDEFYKSLLEDYKEHNLKNHNLVLHFRIGTSGGLTKEKSQPFKITNSIKELNKLYIKNKKSSIVHNGILHDFEYNEENSDTQNYIKDFLQPLLQTTIPTNVKSLLIANTLEDTNKLAILNKDDQVSLYGDFIRYKGIYYSNNSFNGYNNILNSALYNFNNHERKLLRRYNKEYFDKSNYYSNFGSYKYYNFNYNTKASYYEDFN